jgi:Fic family protein
MNASGNKSTRAGRYVLQPAGYRAFIPAPLPPVPPIDLGGRLRDLLSDADYALGRLDGAVLTLPNPDLFVHMYVRNGHRIMEKLFDHPIVTVATVQKWLDVTPAGANNLVNRLVDIGLLREITGYARNQRFRFDPYLKLFEEPEEAAT